MRYFLYSALCCLGLLLLTTIMANAQSGYDIKWVKRLPGSSVEYLRGMVMNRHNNAVLLVDSYSNDGIYTNHPGNRDIYVIEMDGDGNLLNVFAYGGTRDERAYNITLVNEGYLICGSTKSDDGEEDAWVFLINEKGEMQWETKLAGEDTDAAHKIVETPSGEYLVRIKSKSTTLDFEHTHTPAQYEWFVTMNKQGEVLNKFQLHYNDFLILTDFMIDNGAIYAVGYTMTDDFSPTYDYTKYDACLIKCSLNGELEWEKKYGGSSNDYAASIIMTNDGNFIIRGGTESKDGDISMPMVGNNVWFIKVDADGNLLLETSLGGEVNDNMYSTVQNGCHGLISVGVSNSTAVTGMDFQYNNLWIVDLTEDLEPLASQTFYIDTISREIVSSVFKKISPYSYLFAVEGYSNSETHNDINIIRLEKTPAPVDSPALKALPNITNHCLSFEAEQFDQAFTVSIFDMAGKRIGQYYLKNGYRSIDISNFPAGAYIYMPSDYFQSGVFVKY